MKIQEIAPKTFAVIRPEFASNVGLIQTGEGWVAIDSTSTEEEMQHVLDTAGITTVDVKLLLITHADGDHIGGNTLFDCPIIANQLTYDRMAANSDLPKQAYPTETYEKNFTKEFGGVRFEFTHVGGHKPDQSYIWLPQQKALYPSDQVFVGRYPFMMGSQVPVWIESLKKIGEWGADTIVSGHGELPDQTAIDRLLEYIEKTWTRTKHHVQQGHALQEILADPDYIQHPDWGKQNFFEKNIQVMVDQLNSPD